MKIFHTTETLAALVGVTGTTARRRINDGEWKPTAETSSGKALFSDDVASVIVERELKRRERGKESKAE